MGFRVRGAKLLISALCLLGLFASAAPNRATPALAASNPIVTENQQPGTTAWLHGQNSLANDMRGQIKGYANLTSVSQGQPITFYVSVNPPQTFAMDFYRIGWYNGTGARFRLHVDVPISPTQAPCGPADATTGLIACNWQPTYTLTIPSDWTSGAYTILMTNAQGWQNYIIFVVKDGRAAPYLYQQSVSTYQAYNNYPDDGLTGKSLYGFNSRGANTVSGGPQAVKVSFDRPYSGEGDGQFWWYEAYFLRWLERSGYDVTYTTDIDTHANGAELRNHKAFFSVAHDEYWSKEMFDAAQAARDGGVNLGFFGADAAFWQIRFESSASGTANRVVVCYKSASIDPVQGPTTTVNFRSAPVNRPEQTLEGVQYTSSIAWNTAVPYVVTNSSHWVYAGTGLRDGDSIPSIVGYEMDRLFANYPQPPANQVLLSRSPYTNDAGQADYANSSIYQAPSGAWVFGAGTIEWGWGLDTMPWDTVTHVDARIQRITANVLDAFLNGAPVVHHLTVTAPATANGGQAFTTTVRAVNFQGNPVTTYTGSVHFTSSDTQAVLPADYTFTSADAGVHQFSATLKTAGSQSVTATDTITSSITGSATVTVAATASRLGLTGLTSTTAGTGQTTTVTAYDATGVVYTAYRGTVHFTSSDAQAVLPADYTFTSTDAGAHQFPVTLRTAGTQSVTVTDGGATPGSQTVTVSPAAASQLTLSGLVNAAAGTAQTATVSAYDPYGNRATGYTGTDHFTSSDPQATLPADYTFTSADAGTHQFSMTLRTPGNQTVTVTNNGATPGSQTVTISAATPSRLGIVTPPTARANQPFNVTVTVYDQFGNVATGYRGTVHFTASDSAAQAAGGLPADYAFTAGDAGTHVFSVTLVTAGTQYITVADYGIGLSVTSAGITVTLI
jgi:hypothetical protein